MVVRLYIPNCQYSGMLADVLWADANGYMVRVRNKRCTPLWVSRDNATEEASDAG